MFEYAKQSRWWQTLKLTHNLWAKIDGEQRAAAFAYYLLLALLPLMFMLVSIGSLCFEHSVATREVVGWIKNYIPLNLDQTDYIKKTIGDVLESRGKFNLAAFILFLWSVINFQRTLIRGTNRIWQTSLYGWLQRPWRSLALLSITASAVLFGVLVPALARIIRGWVTAYLDFPQWAFTLLFLFIPWVVLFYGLIMIYKLSPSRFTKFSEVWLGALMVTVSIWLGEQLFIFYASNFAQFNLLYGALGGIVAVLLWLYISSCLGVLGICFCAARAETK